MRIAILGWGSLTWEPGDLRIDGLWQRSGPELPIELSRFSEKRQHLTYVIDERHTRRVPTRYTTSRYDNLEDAIADLACREGCPAHWIGFVEIDSGEHRSRTELFKDIGAWAKTAKVDAVIWTDLDPAFSGEWGIDQAVQCWKTRLPATRQAAASEYASKAPVEVATDLRLRLVKEGLIPPAQAEAE